MTALKFNSANWGTGTLYVSLHTSAPPCGVVVTCDHDDQAMPHVRFGQRWSLPDGLEVKSWRGALELTWPAPVVAPVEPVKVEPVAERPAVRVGQVWRDGRSTLATGSRSQSILTARDTLVGSASRE